MQDIFIKRLVELLEEKDMTQLDLSKLIGTTNVTVSRYVNGERKPRIEIVAKIAEALGTSIDYLLGFSTVRNSSNSKIDNSKPTNTIGNKLNSIANDVLENNNLSKNQINIIEKWLDANKELIELLTSNSDNLKDA